MPRLSFKAFFAPIASGCVLLTFLSPVFATCTKAQVEAADARWAKAIDSNEVKPVVDLYAPQAVLLTMGGNQPITTQQDRIRYFTQVFNAYQHAHITYTGQKYIQVLADGAVSSGFYTFSWVKNDKPFEAQARYTFVYKATPNGCELITHHSSQLPEDKGDPER